MLGKTLGVPLFQEQAMKIAIVAAGFTPGEADKLRRAMATFRRVGTIQSFQTKMVEGMAAKGYEREFAERCFRQIEGFGEYGFPESHAASFALLVYASCWMKCRYPDVFLAAMLNSQPLGFYAPSQLVRDAREHGVEVREVDVNLSDWDCTLERSFPPRPVAAKRRMRGRRRPHPALRPASLPQGERGLARIHPRHASMARRYSRGACGAAGPAPDHRRARGGDAQARGGARRRLRLGARSLAARRDFGSSRSSVSPTPTRSARSASTGARRCGRCARSTASAIRTICRCSRSTGPNATPSRTRSCRRCRWARMWSRIIGGCRCR